MKVVKFYAKDNNKVERVIWYINELMKRSTIIKKVENYLTGTQQMCIMDIVKLYHNRQDFDREEKGQEVGKDKFEHLLLWNE